MPVKKVFNPAAPVPTKLLTPVDLNRKARVIADSPVLSSVRRPALVKRTNFVVGKDAGFAGPVSIQVPGAGGASTIVEQDGRFIIVGASDTFNGYMKQRAAAIYPFENRVFENLPGEQWKDIPGFEGEYEISSLGRVRSQRRWRASGRKSGYYTKENIRKQHFRSSRNNLKNDFSYTLSVALKKHGKAVSRSTARYVYYAFIESFDLDIRTWSLLTGMEMGKTSTTGIV